MADDPYAIATAFVDVIYKKIVEDNSNLYRELYLENPHEALPNSYGQKVLSFTRKLNQTDSEALMLLVRQIIIDTISNMFGAIDGISEIGEFSGKLDLIYGDHVSLRGDLQDLFLEKNEE